MVDPLEALKSNSTLLDHLHFSFLVTGQALVILEINELNGLSVLSSKIKGGRIALVSGSLRAWKEAVVLMSSRPLLSKLSFDFLVFFKQLGLGYVFADYTHKKLTNGTFLLEYKVA